MAIIEGDGIVKQYDGVRALDDVSFAVNEGEIFALVGPNGAGKTTLLRLLTDILRPDSGTLRIFDNPEIRRVLSRIGYMPEERGLYKSLTPLATVSYLAELKGLSPAEARKAAEEALESVGMGGHGKRKLEELSKGMAQRIQFAATIAHRPALLILDEPFSGLDPVSARDIQVLIRKRRDAGDTILLSTHNMAHAELLCDRLLMLHRGKVRLYGGVQEVKERFMDDSLLVEFTGELPDVPGVEAKSTGPSSARLFPQNGIARTAILEHLITAGADIVRFEPVEPTLEEIFIQVAGADAGQALRESEAAHALT